MQTFSRRKHADWQCEMGTELDPTFNKLELQSRKENEYHETQVGVSSNVYFPKLRVK
jgi:hypothetical protein